MHEFDKGFMLKAESKKGQGQRKH